MTDTTPPDSGNAAQCQPESPKGRTKSKWVTITLWTVLCITIISGLIAALVWVCRTYFPYPKDTEVGIPALVALLALLAIIAQIIVNLKQWQSAQAANKRTDRIIEQGERSMVYGQAAYVHLDVITLDVWNVNANIEATIKWKNVGQTPAYDVRIFPHLDCQKVPFKFTRTQGLTVHMNDAEIERHPTTLGPQDDTEQLVLAGPLTADFLEKERKLPLHFWGGITYVDIFGRDRWTTFSYRKIVVNRAPQWAMNEDNNDADRPKPTAARDAGA